MDAVDAAMDALYRSLDLDPNIKGIREEQTDSDGDGKLDLIRVWQYDANGNLIQRDYDFNRDGTGDLIETWLLISNSRAISWLTVR